MSVPTVCPKCSGNLVNLGGKPVCEKCFHTVEVAAGAPQQPQGAPQSPQGAPQYPQGAPQSAPQNPQGAPQRPQPAQAAPQQPQVAPQYPQGAPQYPQSAPQNPQGAPQRPQPAQAAPQQPQMAQPTAPVCPKCGGKLVEIGGKPVCEQCFHTVETGAASGPGPASLPTPSASAAPQPTQWSGPPDPSSRPANAYAPQPAPQSLTPPAQGPASASIGECPKCSGNLMDIGGKPVCEQCFHVVDTPSTPARSSSPFGAPAAPKVVAPPPTICPKCSGKLVEAGGNYVCGECYHVIDQPSSTPARVSNNFTPRRTGTSEEEQMSPQMIGGIALILLLILMIVVLAIKH